MPNDCSPCRPPGPVTPGRSAARRRRKPGVRLSGNPPRQLRRGGPPHGGSARRSGRRTRASPPWGTVSSRAPRGWVNRVECWKVLPMPQRPVMVGPAGDVLAVEHHPTGRRASRAGDEAEQRRLAGAVRPRARSPSEASERSASAREPLPPTGRTSICSGMPSRSGIACSTNGRSSGAFSASAWACWLVHRSTTHTRLGSSWIR
jgi:hypothetical protein